MKNKIMLGMSGILFMLGISISGIEAEKGLNEGDDVDNDVVIETQEDKDIVEDIDKGVVEDTEKDIEKDTDNDSKNIYAYNSEKVVENFKAMILVSETIKDGQILKEESSHKLIEELSMENNVDSLLAFTIFFNDLYVMRDGDMKLENFSDEITFMYVVSNNIKGLGDLIEEYGGEDGLEKFIEINYGGQEEVLSSIKTVHEELSALSYMSGDNL